MSPALQDLLHILKCTDEDLHSAYRVGSRVYGCATEASDSDYCVVRSARSGRSDLVFRPGVNITVHTVDTYQTALNEHSLFALECLYAPPGAVLKQGPQLPFKLNVDILLDRVRKTSESDWRKATKLWEDELDASQKKLYHSIRVLMFARQIIQHGRITNFSEANDVWSEAKESVDWTEFEPLRNQLLDSLFG